MRLWRVCSLAAFAWYLFLAVLHFSNLRPLWNDEQCVFWSIQSFSSADFFRRELVALQVFPHLYLWLIKQVSSLFNYSLLSLRFLSFIAMIGAFFIWSGLARKQLASEKLLALFFLSWAASTPLVYYASELKQYSFDVLAAGCFLVFVAHQERLALKGKPGLYFVLLFLLPFLGLFAYPAFLFLIFPLWGLLQEKKHGRRALAVYIAGCAIAVGISFWFDMRLRSKEVISGYGEYFILFSSVGDFLRTFFEGINNLIGRWFASRPSWVRIFCRFFMVFGLVEMFLGTREFFQKKEKTNLPVQVIAGAVFFELVILGALKAYPFTVPRTSLFFCPILFLLALLSFKRIETSSPRWGLSLQAVYLLVVLFFSLAVTRMALSASIGQDITQWLPFK
ncbi:MAG: hypothetical protein HQL16_06865 [Candidatus Omnitrophica bacterium]|nr:hypothetical protein [Candidatus Omnitrophota bacterium]